MVTRLYNKYGIVKGFISKGYEFDALSLDGIKWVSIPKNFRFKKTNVYMRNRDAEKNKLFNDLGI